MVGAGGNRIKEKSNDFNALRLATRPGLNNTAEDSPGLDRTLVEAALLALDAGDLGLVKRLLRHALKV